MPEHPVTLTWYEVMQPRYWKDLYNGRPPAWFAPKEDLHDIADLPRTREALMCHPVKLER